LLRGVNGRPHLDSQGHVAQEQGIWVFRGNDIAVENIEFSGARSRDRNGSGIRFLGRNLTVRDSYFHDNEDGVTDLERTRWRRPDRAQRVRAQRGRRRPVAQHLHRQDSHLHSCASATRTTLSAATR
jgi:hypothetical protein